MSYEWGVPLDPRICYRALRARDRRFDGTFFVAVKTTGIYCRPICPAKVPRVDRCVFVERAAEAERQGYRACFRCRPELAPGSASVDSTSRLVSRAVNAIEGGGLETKSLETLAADLGVTSRHLRRAMEAELGVSPVEYAQTKRLALAKQLLHDTNLSLADVAFAAGFKSVRRFNALFRDRFGRSPSDVRKTQLASVASGGKRTARVTTRGARERGNEGLAVDATIVLRLEYRPPLDFRAMLAFLRGRAIDGVEIVTEDSYARTVHIGKDKGFVRVVHADGDAPALLAHVSMSLRSKLTTIVARLRSLFDLDAQPHAIADHLATDALLGPHVAKNLGWRLPGAFDPFETSMRAILGQQVSVKGATTLSGRLVDAFGAPLAGLPVEGLRATFPTADVLAKADVAVVRRIGMPEARAKTIIGLSRAVHEGTVDLSGAADPEATIAALEAVPGIGPWTASYIAMRALHWPDAFPAGDLGVKKALSLTAVRAIEARAAAWRPWRGYAVMLLWSSLSVGGG